MLFQFLRVAGSSLDPLLRSGDFVLVRKSRNVKRGDVVAFHQKEYGTMIKLVDSVTSPDEIYVRGLPANSVDSRRFGAIETKDVIGKVIWRVRNPSVQQG